MRKGFAVEPYVKPPVSIFISFREEVSLDRIVLDGKVNAQLSNGFILSSSISPVGSCIVSDQSLRQIAKVFNDTNKNTHLYEIKRRSRDNFQSNNSIVAYFSYPRSNPAYLDRLTGLCLVILRTVNRTSPCLASLKVYGTLNRSETITPSLVSKSVESVEIPDEFIDELTHEPMKIPVKLPSQKYVDKSTLDRYLDEFKSENKPGKDPFTRIEFTSEYKPIIDAALKARIDKFYFENQTKRLVTKHQVNETPVLKRKVRENQEREEDTKRSRVENEKKCEACLNKKRPLYELETCKHCFCRSCSLALKNKCMICKREFSSGQIVNLDRVSQRI